MLDPPLNVCDGLARVALVPKPVEVLGNQPELDDQIAGEVLRLGFAAFLAPKAEEGFFIVAHDDAGVGAADEVPPLGRIEPGLHASLPARSLAALPNSANDIGH